MQSDPILEPFARLAPEAIDELAALLARLEFPASAELTATSAAAAATGGDERADADLRHAIETELEDSSLTVMMRLFLLNEPVPLASVEATFGPPLAGALREGGLLIEQEGAVRSSVSIMPYRGIYLVCDHIRAKWLDVGRNSVMSVGTSSVGLANGTPRLPVRRALDVGCGSGFQAIQIAPHAGEVVAIDINPRALALGRFAARLSGHHNIEFRMTDFFSAVQGERFDLIVSNPPFVISPESRFQYRDGGLGADKVTELVLSQAGGHLEEGGLSLTVCEWACYRDSDPVARVRSWMEGNGCDVWIHAGKPADMPAYARNWLTSLRTEQGEAAYRKLHREWMEYYDRVGIESVQMAFVAMRKRTSGAPNWFHVDESPESMRANWWEALLLGLDLQHLLATSTDEEVLARSYRLAPGARFTQELVQRGNRWGFEDGMLQLNGPLVYRGKIDQWIAGLVVRCDGSIPLRPLIEELATMVPIPKEEVVVKALPLIKGLIRRGFLIPTELLPQRA